MKYKFDMIFHIKAAQNMVAEHYLYENYFDMIFQLNATRYNMKSILTWFSTSRRLKTSLQSTRNEIFNFFYWFFLLDFFNWFFLIDFF